VVLSANKISESEKIMEVKYNQFLKYIENIQAQGRYNFSIKESKKSLYLSDEAIKKSLSRLTKKGKIVSVRKGFYIIIPPEYSHQKILPPALFIDQLMSYSGKQYYVGLVSAAAMHGAAHQQPQAFQVISVKPAMRDINVRELQIRFFTKSKLPAIGVVDKKTDTGYVKISGPELTSLDLIQFEKGVGGIARVYKILEELIEDINENAFHQLIQEADIQVACLQRMGFLLENKLDKNSLAEKIFDTIKSKRLFKTYLSNLDRPPEKEKAVQNRWNVVENLDLESEI
jgi:predicted transcriptional regulator of viral defense system